MRRHREVHSFEPQRHAEYAEERGGEASALDGSVRGVVTIGAPYSPEHVANLFGDRIEEIRDHGQATVTLAGRDFLIRERFLDDLSAPNMETAIAGLRRALLVLHSPRDQNVSVENAARIFQAAKHPKSFVSLDDADHLLTREADARYAARLIAAWSTRYVGDSLRGDRLQGA